MGWPFFTSVGGPDDPVNSRGDKLSDSERAYLFGSWSRAFGVGAKSGEKAGLDPTLAATMFSNWLTGGKPPPIDPGVSLARSAAMAGVYERAGAGRGVSGLFGLGNLLGGAQPSAPMQSGVPYSAQPVPSIFRPPKPGGGGSLRAPGSGSKPV